METADVLTAIFELRKDLLVRNLNPAYSITWYQVLI